MGKEGEINEDIDQLRKRLKKFLILWLLIMALLHIVTITFICLILVLLYLAIFNYTLFEIYGYAIAAMLLFVGVFFSVLGGVYIEYFLKPKYVREVADIGDAILKKGGSLLGWTEREYKNAKVLVEKIKKEKNI